MSQGVRHVLDALPDGVRTRRALSHGACLGVRVAGSGAWRGGMSGPAPTRHRAANRSISTAALPRRGSPRVWLDPATPWHGAPSGKRGAQPVRSHAAVQARPTVKVLFGPPPRQTTGVVAIRSKLAGGDWPAPDVSTLCRRQKTLAVQLPCRGPGDPLHLLVDSTGIKVRKIGERHARKHGEAKRHARHRPRTDAGSMPHLRPPDRRTPGPRRHPRPIHSPRHPRHAAGPPTTDGERGTPSIRRIVNRRPRSGKRTRCLGSSESSTSLGQAFRRQLSARSRG